MDLFSTIADSLSQSDFLQGIEEKFHADIFRRGDRVDVKLGEMVLYQGDPVRRCYFVFSGRLKLTKLHEQGKQKRRATP